MVQNNRPSGMGIFAVIWVGQTLSLLGSAMTGFGLSVWAWEKTGQATALAMVGFFFTGATMLASPFAGALVDRWNRKVVMIVSDVASASVTAILLLLYAAGHLQIWHLFVANAFSGAFQALQWPAYAATITMVVSKEHYARASAMISLSESAAFILAPAAAAVLLRVVGLVGVMATDLTTMAIAVAVLLAMRIPRPAATAAGEEGRGSLWKEAAYGFRYIFRRPSLLGLQLVFFTGNFLAGMAYGILAPLVLSRTSNNVLALGSVQSAMGIGMFAGSLVLSVWGGPRRRVHGVLVGWALSCLLGQAVFGLGRDPIFWVVTGFIAAFVSPVVDTSNQALWQAKVEPDVQGRVFSARRLIAQVSQPLALLLAGPLADRVLEPGMRAGGALAPVFGWLVGTGPGTGMALLFVGTGLLGTVAGLAGYAFRAVRDAEDILPDHDAAPQEAAAATR